MLDISCPFKVVQAFKARNTECRAQATSQQQCLLQPDSWSPVSEGFVGDPWLSITLTLCHILHSVSHWPVLVYFTNIILQKSLCSYFSNRAGLLQPKLETAGYI
jgi:hypothetical protein